MLLITRKAGEKIEIGDGIIVQICRISGSRVLVGIDAQDDVGIRRYELPKLVGVRLIEGERVVGYLQLPRSDALAAGRRHEASCGGCRYEIDEGP